MGKIDKLKERLKRTPKDFTYHEARTLLEHLGYVESNKGKTSGSRVCFVHATTKKVILLHKPHPGDIIKSYAVKELILTLEEDGEL